MGAGGEREVAPGAAALLCLLLGAVRAHVKPLCMPRLFNSGTRGGPTGTEARLPTSGTCQLAVDAGAPADAPLFFDDPAVGRLAAAAHAGLATW